MLRRGCREIAAGDLSPPFPPRPVRRCGAESGSCPRRLKKEWPMQVECAWCRKDMGEKPPLNDKSKTHGICQDCYIKELMKAPVAAGKIRGDKTLFVFQILNCSWCASADPERVWSSSPCCRCADMIKIENRVCLNRKPPSAPAAPGTT